MNTIKSKYEKLLVDHAKLQTDYDELIKTKDELEIRLKKYTSPERNKKYYQNHKEELKEKVKEYNKKTNYKASIPKEKQKEYNRQAYLNRKAKLEKSQDICV